MHHQSCIRGFTSLLLVVLASCTTPPPVPPRVEPAPQIQPALPPEALPVLSILAMKATAIDQHRSTLMVTAGVQNPRSADLVLLQPALHFELKLDTGGHDLGTIQTDGDIQVAAFSESTFDLQLEIDTRLLDQGIPGFEDQSVAEVQASLTAEARVQPDATGQPASGLVNLKAESQATVQ